MWRANISQKALVAIVVMCPAELPRSTCHQEDEAACWAAVGAPHTLPGTGPGCSFLRTATPKKDLSAPSFSGQGHLRPGVFPLTNHLSAWADVALPRFFGKQPLLLQSSVPSGVKHTRKINGPRLVVGSEWRNRLWSSPLTPGENSRGAGRCWHLQWAE